MKVLILSCSTGGGHNSCARYIEEELKANNIECEFKDFFDIVSPKGKKLSSKLYLASLKGNGKIFKGVYSLGEAYSNTGITSPVYLVNKLHKRSLLNYIKENNFTLVITTHLFPALTLTAINKTEKPSINFITIATDYEPCPFMEESKPNMLIIQKGLEEKFIKKGNAKETLIPIGIPISTRFTQSVKNIREGLNLNEKDKVVLIMLGSMGFGKILELLKDLENEKYKIITICGSNKKLLSEIKNANFKNVIPLGFIKNINDYIYSSDIIVSKPGGLSTTEIAAMRKPLIHIFPIPGIETYNTNFFESHHMSIKCMKNEEIKEAINTLFKNQNLQNEIIENQKKYINNYSARDLVELIKENF